MDLVLDYAGVDQNAPPVFSTVKQSARTVILRGAYGLWQDPIIHRDLAAARAAELAIGVYFFPTFDRTPEEEVAALAQHVVLAADELLAIDIENVKPENLPWLTRAVELMKAAFHRIPLIYTSERVWREDLHNPARPQQFADCPLWLAHYPWRQRIAPQSNPGEEPAVPYGWQSHDWWLHQYQGDALGFPGFSSTVDISRFQDLFLWDRGARVEWVQRRLNMPVDGVYGPATCDAVKAKQREANLIADGIVGPRTLAVLCNA